MFSKVENIKELLNEDVYKMTEVNRFATRKRLHEENIASHSFIVLFQCKIIADKLRLSANDKCRLYEMAISHDLPEAILGDIISPVKNSNEVFKETYEKMEKEVIEKHFKEFQGAFYDMLDHEKKNKYLFKILKLADLLSVVYYAEQEKVLGSRSVDMEEIYHITIDKCDKLWSELKKECKGEN